MTQLKPSTVVREKHPAVLTFRASPAHVSTEGGGLRYLGRAYGFSSRLEFVANDPFIYTMVHSIFGEIPESLQGYSRSGASLPRLRSGLEKYDRVYKPLPKGDKWFDEAVRITYAAFRLPDKLRPAKLEDVEFQPDTSPGWTFHGHGNLKRDVYDEALLEARKLERLARNGRWSAKALPPVMCFKRTQLAPLTEPKVRLVWGYPFELTLLEGRYAQPIIHAMSQFDGPMFVGRTLLKELPLRIDAVCARGKGLALDWSRFDATVSPGLIRLAFDVLLQNYQMTPNDWAEMNLIITYFIRTKIVMPDGEVYAKSGGVPSGSFFTQLVDSVVNFLVITYLQLLEYDGDWCRTYVLGDDSLTNIPEGRYVDLTRWARIASEKFGLILNTQKSVIAREPCELEFLGHRSLAGRIYRETERLLLLALYPEQKVVEPEVSVSRILGILLDSGFQSWPVLTLARAMIGQYEQARGKPDKVMRILMGNDELFKDGRIPREVRLWARS